MLIEAAAGAGIGIGAKALKGVFGKSKKAKRQKRKLRAQNAALAQENQALREKLQFATGLALGQQLMRPAACAARGCGYGSLMQSFSAQQLSSQTALLQSSTLGATSALMGVGGGAQGLVQATAAISTSAAFSSANGRFNAYQMTAYQQAQWIA
jgi:hypothetical protein